MAPRDIGDASPPPRRWWHRPGRTRAVDTPSSAAAETDRAFSALAQRHGRADAVASANDTRASQSDRTGSRNDHVGSDADQRASDADQVTADRELRETASPSPAHRADHAAALQARAETTRERRATEAAREQSELARARQEQERLETAVLRDELASERDRAADLQDAAVERLEASLLHADPGNQALRTLTARNQETRERVRAERQAAVVDRQAAAVDRVQSAADRREAQIAAEFAQLDGLTGVHTRALGFEAVQREIDRCRRSKEPMVLVFFDVDGLKAINDRDGHAAGDAMLRWVVSSIQDNIRTYDPLVRVGGDEFLCGLSSTDLTAAHGRVQVIRAAVAAGTPPGSVSAGFAALEDHDSLESLIARADADMYARRARNRRTEPG